MVSVCFMVKVLAGFIFFGIDTLNEEKTAWDGGTGVLPTYRGQKLTERMFEHMRPVLKGIGISRVLLEVLKNNIGAQKTYSRLGFKTIRELNAYKGLIAESNIKHKIEVLTSYDAEQLLNLGDWQPSWQFTNTTVLNWGNAVTTICIKRDEKIVAYAHYNNATKRVYQFAVSGAHRRQGMATSLFNYIAGDNTVPISVVNVDSGSENSNAFLKSIGLEHFLTQYEMDMCL